MKERRWLLYAFFLGPSLTLITVFYLVPLVLSIYISFTGMKNWDLSALGSFIGSYNYDRLLRLILYDPDVYKVVLTTLFFVAATLVVNVLGGLGLALAAFFMDELSSSFFRTLWLLPRMTPIAVYSLLWYYFFLNSFSGTLNGFLHSLGVIDKPIGWGTDLSMLPWGAWMILVYVNGLVGVSYGMIIFYSALKTIPREQIIAARVDGASTLQVIRYVLIPSLRWHLMFVTVWQLLSLITTYAHIFLLVEWGAVDRWWGSTWALFVFTQAFAKDFSDQGLAAAAATVLVGVGIGLGLLTLRLLGFGKMMHPPRGEI